MGLGKGRGQTPQGSAGPAPSPSPAEARRGEEPHGEFLLPPLMAIFVLGGMGKWQGKVKFGLGGSRSSGLALQGQRMFGGDSSSSCPFILRAPAWPVIRHPIFNTSAPNCMKIGNSLQFLQIRCVQLPGLSPQGCLGGSLGPAPFLPKSSLGPWKKAGKQDGKEEKRDRDPTSWKHETEEQPVHMELTLLQSFGRRGRGDFFELSKFPFLQPKPLSQHCRAPQSCPIPHSPKSPVLSSGEAARTSAGTQSSSGTQKGNKPTQRFCCTPKTAPVGQSSGTGEPQPHHTRCGHPNVPNVTCEPKPPLGRGGSSP